MMEGLKDFLWTLVHPSFHNMKYRYSKPWDDAINLWMNEGAEAKGDCYSVKIKDRKIWVGNYPYAFCIPYGWGVEVRPSRRTIKRFRDYIEQQMFKD